MKKKEPTTVIGKKCRWLHGKDLDLYEGKILEEEGGAYIVMGNRVREEGKKKLLVEKEAIRF